MIDDALTNPPVPDWNELSNDERMAIGREWEMHSCPHACGGSVIYVYEAIRRVLKVREQRIWAYTMGVPAPSLSVEREANHFWSGSEYKDEERT